MIKDKALNDVMKSKMGQLHGGLTIKIEVEPNEEKDELKKQGLAPALPEKDEEVKQLKGPDQMEPEVVDELASPEEQSQLVSMAGQGQKPKGLMGKAEQIMAMKKIEKNTKDGNA